jgi:LemA protein
MIVTLCVAGALVLATCGSYTSLVGAQENVNTQWGVVESKLQRRMDLVPNLVAAVKGVMAQEQKIFGELAQARANYSGARTTSEKAAAATQMEGALGRLLVVMENYPELKSSEAVRDLMSQLEGTENRISVERDRFNVAAGAYNKTRRGPLAFLGKIFADFPPVSYYAAKEGADVAPIVDLGGGK